MIEFRVLSAKEFAEYGAYFVPDYALDLIANHGMTAAAAKAKAKNDLDITFPDGPDAPGQSLLAIVIEDGLIGYLWYEAQASSNLAFVQDFHILPAFQGRGHAKAAMAAFERRAATEGFAQIRLRVAPDNPVARHIYDAAGFRVSGINMFKPVA